MKEHIFLTIHLLLQQLKPFNLVYCFLKISGKVAVKSGSKADEEGAGGWGTRLLDCLGSHNMLWARFDQHFLVCRRNIENKQIKQ